jgi:hypothetical protein
MGRELDTLGRQLIWLSLELCGVGAVIGLMRGLGLAQSLRSSVVPAIVASQKACPHDQTILGLPERPSDTGRWLMSPVFASVGVSCLSIHEGNAGG